MLALKKREDHMLVRKKLPCTVAAALACAIFTLNAAHANDGVTFRDALNPDGKARSSAQKIADGVACGTIGRTHTIPFMPTFEKCMNGKGWVLDHYTSNDVPAPGDRTTHYVDIRGDNRGIGRGNAALQADTRACRASRGPSIDACLAERGWKVMLTKYGAPLPRSRVASSPAWSWSSPSSSTERDDDQRRTDEFNRTTQQNSDSNNATIQATNDANAAAATQAQVDQNLANMPMPAYQ
jgi:hypothetical protein